MCPFIETIKVENRGFVAIEYHNDRLNRTVSEIFGGRPIRIEDQIEIPSTIGEGVYKCRILYQGSIESVEFHAYTPRLVKSLKILHSPTIDYCYKSSDRRPLDDLFSMRGEYDDILIVKNSLITDTSYSNIAFYDGSLWYTPDKPLLRGTKRQKMIDESKLKELPIRLSDLRSFVCAKPINAMLDFEATCPIRTSLIGE